MTEPPFDVFLCHHSDDKPAVEKIARQLRDGIVQEVQVLYDEE